MTDSEPITGLTLSPEAIAEANDLAAQLSSSREWGPVEARDLIAAAIQRHINAAELAEAERLQAVRAANTMRQRLFEVANHAVVDTWATCPRCHVRAPNFHGGSLKSSRARSVMPAPMPNTRRAAPSRATARPQLHRAPRTRWRRQARAER